MCCVRMRACVYESVCVVRVWECVCVVGACMRECVYTLLCILLHRILPVVCVFVY